MLLDKGDKKGVEDEITKLEKKLKELDKLSLTDEERQTYDQQKQIIDSSTRAISQLEKDYRHLDRLQGLTLLRDDIEMEFTTLSEAPRKKIEQLYGSIKSETQKRWREGLSDSLALIDQSILSENDKIRTAQENPTYLKAAQAYSNSTQLQEIQDLIKEQKLKLNEINSITKELSELQKQRDRLRQKIITKHNEYFLKASALIPQLSDSQDGLEINAKYQFNANRYREILEGALNLQSAESKATVDFKYSDNSDYAAHVTKLMDSLMASSLTLKGGYSEQSLISAIMAECFYEIAYDLVYENDNFQQMSDGKKAFVVLKLLLDFSDKKCPILIDQPEDDLDNRAIYLDLVKYLKKKKVARQIIVATHNPNIVVGADSELVIVANQHGLKSENTGGKKFAYKTGSLENSKPLDEKNKIVLDSQGIREHVCDVLEGGNTAFKLREKKYAIAV